MGMIFLPEKKNYAMPKSVRVEIGMQSQTFTIFASLRTVCEHRTKLAKLHRLIMMKIMSAKCSNTNIGMKNIQFWESTRYHISFYIGTIKALKAVKP